MKTAADSKVSSFVIAALLLSLLVAIQVARHTGSEPFFNGDETRHVMTGVFFRDLIVDHPVTNIAGYTKAYYNQYPALGLVVWPPFFYLVEGIAMVIFGTSFAVSKLTIAAFTALAAAYLFQLVRYTHDRWFAAAAAALFLSTPMIVMFSTHVMLEVPFLALSMGSIYHWLKYLDQARRRDLILSTLFATLAALTRFDVAYLGLALLLLAAGRGNLKLLLRRDVLAAGAVAILAILPVYWISFVTFSSLRRSVPEGIASGIWSALWFYPRNLPNQVSWVVAALALVGLAGSLRASRRSALLPYVVMIVSVYAIFTPIAERSERHSIDWIPAWTLLALEGVSMIARSKRTLALGFAALFAVTFTVGLRQTIPEIRGYAEAAVMVDAQFTEPRICLFDGWLDGDFTYQLRRVDASRRDTVLRGDKLLYSMAAGVPNVDYTEYARSDQEILDVIDRAGASLIVLESRSAFPSLSVANRLRTLVRERTDRFQLIADVPVDTNLPTRQGFRIQIFRNRYAQLNPSRVRMVE